MSRRGHTYTQERLLSSTVVYTVFGCLSWQLLLCLSILWDIVDIIMWLISLFLFFGLNVNVMTSRSNNRHFYRFVRPIHVHVVDYTLLLLTWYFTRLFLFCSIQSFNQTFFLRVHATSLNARASILCQMPKLINYKFINVLTSLITNEHIP